MMTLQPISRSSEFEAVATRNFLKSTGELFWLSSKNRVNFRGEKQSPQTVFLYSASGNDKNDKNEQERQDKHSET